ncbi:Fbd-associated f-box protein, partial [Thalictrum thalictroides]
MDANTSTRKSKKRCNGKKKKAKEEVEDRISCLPDCILHHILSFLPTHYAVGTSLLSKRWKYLWTGISRLDFDEFLIGANKMYENMDFIDFVEGVFLEHDPTTAINKFRLICDEPIDECFIISWISAALKRKVQKIHLHISEDSLTVFPASLFSCETLTVLKLTAVLSVLELPASICFSSIKVMHLKSLVISCEESIQQVSFRCPVLEEVMWMECSWERIKVIDIFAPKLERMVIDDSDNDIFTDCEIKIYAESLVTMLVTSCLAFDISLHNILSLDEAFIKIYSENGIGYRANKLLQGISNVKHLHISLLTLILLSSTKDLLALSSLKSLTVTMSTFVNGKLLTDLFCSLPNVESLIFTSGLDLYSHEGYDWTPEAFQPFLSHLKSFEISNFNGNETELSLVEFLLKNAIALEKITIVSSSTLSADPMMQLEITTRLLCAPRGPMGTRIEYSLGRITIQLPKITDWLLITTIDPDSALAASGGRIGGKSFPSSSSSKSSYSSSESPSKSSYSSSKSSKSHKSSSKLSKSSYSSSPLYSRSSSSSSDSLYSSTSYVPSPRVGGSSGVIETGVIGIMLLIAVGMIIGALLNAYVKTPSKEQTSVIKLQVCLLGMARSLQKDLEQLAEVADTSTPEGLNYILKEATLALLRHPDFCISGCSS